MAVHCGKLIGLLGVVSFLAAAPPSWAQTSAKPAAGNKIAPEAAVEKGIQKIEMGDLEDARRLLQYAASLKPTLDGLKLGQGLLFVASNQGPQAISGLTAYNATEEGKRDYRGFAALGKVYLQSRMLRQAVSPLRQAMTLAPPEKDGKQIRAGITIDLATAYMRLKDIDKTLELIKEAQAAARDDGESQLRVSEIAAAVGDSELANGAANQAIELLRAKIMDDPFNVDAHTMMKRAYEVLGNLLNTNIKNDPKNGEHYFFYTRVLKEAAELDHRIGLLSAREMALRAVEQDPKNAQWQLAAVRLEMELGGLADAKTRLDTVLKNDPANEQALQLKERIEMPTQRAAVP